MTGGDYGSARVRANSRLQTTGHVQSAAAEESDLWMAVSNWRMMMRDGR